MNTSTTSNERAATALAKVGVAPGDLLKTLSGLLDGATPYLVGSLSAGLGNGGSDIDVHLFVDADSTSSAPMMFFVGPTIVDAQYFQHESVRRDVAALSTTAHLLAGTPCMAAPAPDLKACKRLSRWLTATPLWGANPAILTSDEESVVRAALVRDALERSVLAVAHAELAVVPAVAALAWRRAGRTAVALLVQLAGDVFVGDKWTWKKATRSRIDPVIVTAFGHASTATQWRDAWEATGLPPIECHRLSRLAAPASAVERVVADNTYLLIGTSVLVPLAAFAEPASLDPVERNELIGAGALVVEVRHDELNTWLEAGA